MAAHSSRSTEQLLDKYRPVASLPADEDQLPTVRSTKSGAPLARNCSSTFASDARPAVCAGSHSSFAELISACT
jgi:hypothetical protein